MKDYDDNEIDVLYTKEHPERQKLIKPIQPTWEQRLSEWEKEEYKGKTFAENIPVITTAKGERVRSKSEKSWQIIFIIQEFRINMSIQ